MREEVQRTLTYVQNRARYYAKTFGPAVCGTCGKEPADAPVFTETMSCGHGWETLIYKGRK